MNIEFGIHRGSDLGEIPTDYLQWLLESLEDDVRFNARYPDLEEAIVDELSVRDRSHAHFYTRDL